MYRCQELVMKAIALLTFSNFARPAAHQGGELGLGGQAFGMC
jgi:hypothetical protein